MNAEGILTVSSAVVLLTQILKWGGVTPKWAPLTVVLVSAAGVAFWVVAKGMPERALLFEYFAAWVSVTASAAGVYGFIREVPEQVASFRKVP